MKRLVFTGLHVAFWGISFLLLIMFDLVSWRASDFSFREFWHAIINSRGSILIGFSGIVSFYIFYTILFTRLLRCRRLALLGLAAVAVPLGSALLVFLTISQFMFPSAKYELNWNTGIEILVLGFIDLVCGIVALIMRGFVSFYGEIQLKEYLKRQNAELELALIKSQISPHFLFNTLNNIDVLIEKDAARASGYLNKLSDILRFMLYDAKSDRIPIRHELRYIEKYIELQKIRTANPGYIHFTIEGDSDQLMVEPLLFLPFVENAFKHAVRKGEDVINIRFKLDRQRVTFDCENRYNPAVTVPHDLKGGLGNSLIRKRLLLLYPGRHTLEINTDHDTYKASLTLTSHVN